jgi:UDP-N-acetylglucosamine 2-epimerase
MTHPAGPLNAENAPYQWTTQSMEQGKNRFMKAVPVSEAPRKRPGRSVMLVHTGQHYDWQMSELYFEELGTPKPDLDLQVGSGSHGEQTGLIMLRIERILEQERPGLVLAFGDVNSTVAAAHCAARLRMKVAQGVNK